MNDDQPPPLEPPPDFASGAESTRNGGGPAAGPRSSGAVRPAPRQPPRVTLVLGGGGMKGFAHIGVVRAMERLGLPIDEVVGTSMGAVMGAAVASGMPSEQIESVISQISVKDYFRLNLLKFLVRGYRHASVYKGKRFHEFLQSELPIHDFAELPKPFFCNALSLTTGTMRYFGLPGAPPVSVPDAVYASACLPGVFEPMEIDGDHYIDGGMAETLGLKIADTRRPDLIIAVDLSIKDHHVPTDYRASLPHILYQTYEIMGSVLNEHNLHQHAGSKNLLLIKPKVGDIGLLEANDVSEVVRRGESEAYQILTTHPLTRYLCAPEIIKDIDRTIEAPRDYVELDVDMNACIHCGLCAVACATDGFAAVPWGNVVRKLHHYECTRDAACERSCPTRAIRLRNL